MELGYGEFQHKEDNSSFLPGPLPEDLDKTGKKCLKTVGLWNPRRMKSVLKSIDENVLFADLGTAAINSYSYMQATRTAA